MTATDPRDPDSGEIILLGDALEDINTGECPDFERASWLTRLRRGAL